MLVCIIMILLNIHPFILQALLFLNQYSGAISLIFALIGGVFVYIQWKKSLKIKRADFIYRLLEKIRFDEDLQHAMYIVDYVPNWYGKDFHGGDLEHSIDRLFCCLDYICYLKKTRNIFCTEFNAFRYDVHRVCVSKSAAAYLWNLYHFSQKNNTDCQFINLINYGIKEKILPKDFKSNKSRYEKYLNW